jgi:valine dehydrogenase (NAD+)
VCVATNNQLSSDEVLPLLDERGIAYVPDFIANAGGLIAVADEIRGFDAERVGTRVAAIGECVHDLLEEARLEGETTLAAAHRRADRRLAAARLPRAA